MASVAPRRVLDALLSPPSPQAKSGQIAVTGLRLLAGLMWLENVAWEGATRIRSADPRRAVLLDRPRGRVSGVETVQSARSRGAGGGTQAHTIGRSVMSSSQGLKEVLTVAARHAERVDAEGAFPAEAVDVLRAGGLLGLVLPREIGGVGAGPVEFTEVVAELAAVCGSTAMIYLMHVSAAVAVTAAPRPVCRICWRTWPPEGRSARWRSARRGLDPTSGHPSPQHRSTATTSPSRRTRAS